MPQDRVSPEPALVDPHRDVVLAAADHELDVDALGEDPVVVLGRLVQGAGLGQVVDEDDGVRVAHRHVPWPGRTLPWTVTSVSPSTSGVPMSAVNVVAGACRAP